MNTTINLPYLSMDLSGMFPEFSPEGLVRWAGKIRLVFDNGAGKLDVITANWCASEESRLGKLVDFEGDSDDESLYAACKVFADVLAAEISAVIGFPDRWDAHARDIAWRRAKGKPPFHKAA